MNITKEQANEFINEELIPIVRVDSPEALSTLADDFKALDIALTSGNITLVFAMATYITKVIGLRNGGEIAKRITDFAMTRR